MKLVVMRSNQRVWHWGNGSWEQSRQRKIQEQELLIERLSKSLELARLKLISLKEKLAQEIERKHAGRTPTGRSLKARV